MQKTTLRIILILLATLTIALVVKADNYLTNPSFTDNITGWTVGYVDQGSGSIIEYDGYHQDSAGSLKGSTGTGKKVVLQGYAEQEIGTSINSDDTVKLRLYVSKRSVIGSAQLNTIKAQIAKPSASSTWVDIWSTTTIPAANGSTTWADTGEIDVTSDFDETGTYKFRWYFDLKSANSNGAQAFAWVDNTSLDVTAAVPNLDETHYRWRNDDGGENGDRFDPSHDGYIVDQSNGPGGVYGGSYLSVGYHEYGGTFPDTVKMRSYLSFDTSGIPDNATITEAVLRIKTESDDSTDEDTDIDVYFTDYGSDLDAADWDSSETSEGTLMNTLDYLDETYFEINVSVSNISKTGLTQYKLKGDETEHPGDENWERSIDFYSDGSSGNEPMLIVTYEGGGASWKTASEDTATSSQAKNEVVRVRFLAKNTGDPANNYNYRLQVAPLGGAANCTSVATSTFEDVPTTTATSAAVMATSTYIYDGQSTKNLSGGLTDPGGCSWATGTLVTYPSNQTDDISLAQNYFTEIEYAFKFTNSAGDNTPYCFRVRNNGTADLDSYARIAKITTAEAAGITISGTVFGDEGNTSSTEGAVVHLVVDGVSDSTTTASTTDGSYSFTSVTQPSTSSVITVYLDNSTSTGVTVTRYSGSGNLTGLNIYRYRTIVRHEDSGPITISDLAKYDAEDDGDILFTAASSSGTLTASSTSEFFVWSGDTFGAWGDGGVGGEISLDCVDINATFTATSTQTIEVSCGGEFADASCWDATGGTFTSASSKVRFISTAGGKTITTGGTGNSFYDIEFDGSGGGWSFDTGDHKVSNNFTITTGSVTSTSGTLQVGGSWSNLDTFNHGDGTVTFNDTTGSKTINGGSSAFYTLTFDGTGGGWQLSTSTLDIDDSLNLTNGTLDASSQNITLAKDLTIASGFTFTKGAGIFTFDGADTHTWTDGTTTDMGSVAINGTTETINLGSDVKATALKIWSGNAFDPGSHTFTIAGSGTGESKPFIVEGTFNSSTSIAQYTGTSTVDVASTTYYSLKLDQSSGTFQLSGDTTTTNAVNIAAGTLDATVSNYNLAVGGNWTNGDTFTCQNGTVTFYDNSATSTFSGATTFFHFTCETESKVLEFATGTSATTTVNGNLILDGQGCGTQIQLRSVDSPAQWYIDATTTASTTIDYIDVKDSYSVKPLTAENSEDSGNNDNSNWTINEGACATAFTQNDYRWYANIDNITPTTALDSTNTAITNATSGTVFRIRMNVSITSQELATGTQAFKLQYATTTYLGDCTSTLSWGNVGATSSAETWRGYDNDSVSDGDAITALKLGNSEIKESYEEANNSTSNPAAIPVGQEGEWDWVVQFNAAYSTTTYCFRMVESGGGVLSGYTNYPKITSLGPATWKADEDVNITNVSTSTEVRLRFLMANISTTTAASNYNYQLEYAAKTGDCTSETYIPMPISTSTGPFEMATSSYFIRGDSTTHRLNDPASCTFTAGELVEDPYATTGDITLNTEIYTEAEYMFYVTATATAGWYCFRVTNDGTGLDSYSKYAQLQIGTAAVSISGTCKEHDQTASTTSGTVRVAVNDSLQSATGTISAGDWTISNVTVGSGQVVTVWVDGAATTSRAVAVTKYDGDGNIDGIELYERHLSIGSNDNQTITNDNLSQYDNSVSSDADVFHNVTSTVLTVDANSDFTDEELYIKASNTLTPGGDTNTHDIEIQGTFTAAGAELHTVSGGWVNSGTFTAASSTVKFTTTSAASITTNGQNFYNLIFDGSSGEWTPQDAITADGNLTMTDGTLAGSQDVTVNGGNATGTSNGTITLTGGTFTLAGTGSFGVDASLWTFNNLTFGSGSSATTSKTGTDNIKVNGVLTVSASQVLQASSTIWELAASGTPFAISGTFLAQSSIFKYTSAASTTVATTTYYRLELSPSAGGGPTYTIQSGTLTTNGYLYIGDSSNAVTVTADTNDPTLDIVGDFEIRTGATFTASDSGGFSVGGSWSNAGTFTHSNGTVVFDASSAGKTVDSGDSPFYKVDFNNASGGWTIVANATSTNDWKITTSTSFAATSSITIEVQGNYDIADSIPAVTTWNSNSVLYLNSSSAYTAGSKNQGLETYATLQIGDSTDIRLWNSTATTYTIDSAGSLYSQDHANSDGELYAWGDYHTTSTDYWSYAKDFDGTAGADRQCQVTINATTSITVDSGESLEIKGGGSASGDITTVAYSPASGSWNLNNEAGSGLTFQEATIEYMKVATGTVTVLNTTLNSEAAPASGAVLNADWYLGVHAVMVDSTSTNATTATTTISEESTTSQATVWEWSVGGWATSATSQVTHTGNDGKIPQPGTDGAIRIREYKKEGATTTYYKYNLEISAKGFANYDYENDYGNYIISVSSTESTSTVDKCISESWQRDATSTMNSPYTCDAGSGDSCINKAPNNGSWYAGLTSDLEFGLDSLTVNFDDLDDGNSYTDTASTTIYVTTTAPNGYIVHVYTAANDGKLISTSTTSTIARWNASNATPTAWEAGNYGFGYTTDDNSLAGGTANRFSTSTNYAGFTSSTEEVADRSYGSWSGETNVITYKVSVSSAQEAATYQTTITFICTAQY